jgi:hypothetical protein
MKMTIKVLLMGLCLSAITFAGTSLWLSWEGKKIIADRLSRLLNRRVAIERLEFIFPATIQIHNLTIEGKIPARKIEMQMALSSFVTDRLRVFRLVLLESKIKIRRSTNKQIQFVDFPPLSPQLPGERLLEKGLPPPASRQHNNQDDDKKIGMTLIIDQLVVINGRLGIEDESLPGQVKVTLEQVNIKIHDLELPPRQKHNIFICSAKVAEAPLPLTNHSIGAQGWLNLSGGDMEAKVLVLEPDGHIGLNAQMTSRQNDMLVRGRLDLKNLGTMVRENVPTEKAGFDDTLLSGLRLAGLQMVADFEFKTKMDTFSLQKVELSGNLGFSPAEPISEEEKQLLSDFEKMKAQFETFRHNMMTEHKESRQIEN